MPCLPRLDARRKPFLERLGDIFEETQTQCYADAPSADRRIAIFLLHQGTEKAKTNPEDPVDRACPVGAKHRTGVKNNKISGRGKSVYLFSPKAVFSRR